jgi:hypothetical protein
MSLHPDSIRGRDMTAPKTPKDLSLAPVAVAIDANLHRLRTCPSTADVEYELQLELGQPPRDNTREERAARILAVALRDVDLHGWNAAMTEDGSAIHLAGGSVTLDLAVGAAAHKFLEAVPSAA